MKKKIIILLACIVFITSCAVVNVNNVGSKLSKLQKKDKIVSYLRKINEKKDYIQLEVLLKELSLNEYPNHKLNNFLRDELLGKLENKSEFQLITIEAIINQKDDTNIDFFMGKVVIEFPKLIPDIENAIVEFGENKISKWQKYLDIQSYFSTNMNILRKFKNVPIEFIFERYLRLFE